ncbi:MAG: ribonuclease HII [Bacilli bacterium]|nr:ribonuclease HII [Bacilli bacterium]
MNDLYQFERDLWSRGYQHIVGTDEVGRGPMAGPLVAAAVILPQSIQIPELNDSKKLSPKKREVLYQEILKYALEVHVTFIDVEEVDRLNVYQASKKAMRMSIEAMRTPVDYILTDAMPLEGSIPCMDIIKGDSKSASIAAASIVAKVIRDREMVRLHQDYPMYGFNQHKGYVTKAHLAAISTYGISPHHRKSFAPVQKILLKTK